MTTRKAIQVGLVSAACVLALAGTSSAQTCKTSNDCPKGSSCQETTVAVAGTTEASPPACPKDQPNCGTAASGGAALAPAVDGGAAGSPAPVTTTELYCQPIKCTVDSDCGTGLVCNTQTATSCSGSAPASAPCPANQVCPPVPPPAPPVCTTSTYSYCAFKWQLPCNADADCGDSAFTCQPNASVTCSGGSATGSGTSGSGSGAGGTTSTTAVTSSTATGGASSKPTVSSGSSVVVAVPPTPPGGTPTTAPPVCTSTTSFPGYCQIKNSACSKDSDCPADFTCVSAPDVTPAVAGTAVATSPGIVGGAGGASQAPAKSSVPPTAPGGSAGSPSSSASKFCQAPGSYGFATPGASGSATGSSGSNSGAPGQTGGTGTAVSSGPTGATPAPTNPPRTATSDSGGATAGATGTPPATTSAPESATAPKASGGCSVGGGRGNGGEESGGFGLALGVLGLAVSFGLRLRHGRRVR